MQLKDILDICRANEVEHFEYTVVNGDINTTVTGIASDSRKVTDGGIFVCIVGSVSDGHKYIVLIIFNMPYRLICCEQIATLQDMISELNQYLMRYLMPFICNNTLPPPSHASAYTSSIHPIP